MLSIIIPVYKTEKYLPKCLDSLLAQSYEDWEAILVDDGSPDGSGDVCEAYAARDSRFRVIHQENAGPGAARNRGMAEMKGDFFIFVDSDDWVAPDYLAQIMAPGLEKYDAVFWGYTEIDGDKVVQERKAPELRGWDDVDEDGNVIQDKSLQVVERLIADKLFGYTVCCRFRSCFVQMFELDFKTDIHIHEDLIFTTDYCQAISSACSIGLTGYYYRRAEGASLSHRYYPVKECLNVALYFFEATDEWVRWNSRLADYAIYTYLSKLNLAVMNCFDKRELPKKSYRERLACICVVQNEVRRYYGKYPSICGFSHKIYKYLNPHLICCYQLLYRYIR